MTYATVKDVEAGFRDLTADEKARAGAMLEEAGIMIDTFASGARGEAKKIVSCRMVRRAIGDGAEGIPIGATQGSQSALGYSQSWTVSGGSTGELYLSRLDKQILGIGARVGFAGGAS